MPLQPFRHSQQRPLPAYRETGGGESAGYELYPVHPLERNTIALGFDEVANRLHGHAQIRIDGFVGNYWEDFIGRLQEAFAVHGVRMAGIDIASAWHDSTHTERIVADYLGGDDPLFGNRVDGQLRDFFDEASLAALQPARGADCTVLFGCGAGLVPWEGPLVYVDLPKNELQYRSRAGTVTNLFMREPTDPKSQYKRFYFVDWPLLNRHKAAIHSHIDWFVDSQRPDEPTIVAAKEVCNALGHMSRTTFRVRPWFEPGPWGGQWIKQHIPALPQDVPNYAWSFELIVPENGLVFCDGQHLLELAFDWLMIQQGREVLGESFDVFGTEFPIRFDFLDTMSGGNLSVQCHPRPEFIHSEFGENFTQDECYYILDCQPGAEVYLGFVAGIDGDTFRHELENSFQQGTEVDVKRYVNTLPSHKHDLYLIPNGTIHCSGAGNLVLEISATPYIFTFKMYDWLRMDLDGRPRPLNIDRAWKNLYFERQGARVEQELVSKPRVIHDGADWQLVHLPTHNEHFYDVHRFEFDTEVTANTEGSPHVMMLVEGSSVSLETSDGTRREFHYAETFVVPAAAESYRLINHDSKRAFVVKAFLKSPVRI